MIFLTVGSMFPFDRLIRTVDDLVGQGLITEPLLAQIGDGRYEPRHVEFCRFLGKPDYDLKVQQADRLIAHAGAGTIALALRHRKPLLVVPRLHQHGEHVNDHQLATARKFAELGHVLVARDSAEILAQMPALQHFMPRPREVRPQALAQRIGDFMDTLLRARR